MGAGLFLLRRGSISGLMGEYIYHGNRRGLTTFRTKGIVKPFQEDTGSKTCHFLAHESRAFLFLAKQKEQTSRGVKGVGAVITRGPGSGSKSVLTEGPQGPSPELMGRDQSVPHCQEEEM